MWALVRLLSGSSSVSCPMCFRFSCSEIHPVLSALGQHLWCRPVAYEPVRELEWKAPTAPWNS